MLKETLIKFEGKKVFVSYIRHSGEIEYGHGQIKLDRWDFNGYVDVCDDEKGRALTLRSDQIIQVNLINKEIANED